MSTTKYIGDEAVIAIENAMPASTRGVWRLCCETGIRVSDALKARYCDFDSDGTFRYKAKKTGKQGVTKVSKQFLDDYIGKSHSKRYIFLSPALPKSKNKPVTRQTVFNHIKLACKRCGINPAGIAPHSARKHFAVEVYKKKGLGEAMRALQHGSVSTTLVYAMSDDVINELRKRCEVIEKRIEKFADRFAEFEELFEAVSDALIGDNKYEVTPAGKHYEEMCNELLKGDKLDSE